MDDVGGHAQEEASVGTETPHLHEDRPPPTARVIADLLEERKLPLMHRVVRVLGHKTAWELCELTLDIEKEGGMLVSPTADDSWTTSLLQQPQQAHRPQHAQLRRRTSGVAFFTLVKQRATKREYQEIYEVENRRKRETKKRMRYRAKQRMDRAINQLGFDALAVSVSACSSSEAGRLKE